MTQYVYQPQIGDKSKTRRLAISDREMALLNAVGQEVGVQFEVVSGGQDGTTGYKGSTRHDHGGAADVRAYQLNPDGSRGRKLSISDPAGQAVWRQIARVASSYGATGIGMAEGYMGDDEMHIGFQGANRTGPQAKKASGYQGTWGVGGKSAAAPQWLQQAYNEGKSGPALRPPSNIPDAPPQPQVRPASLSISPQAPVPRQRPALPSPGSLPALPQSAMYGVGRLVPGQKTQVPTDFTTADVGAPDLRVLGMGATAPPAIPSAATYGQPPVTQAQTLAEQRMMRPQVNAGPPQLPTAPVPMPGRPIGLQASAAGVPPVPMPGRPMALQGAPMTAPAVPPTIPRTALAPPQAMAAMQRPAAPQQQLVRLANGGMIPVGFTQGSNGPVNITDDGRGNAVVTKIRNPGSIPGVIDPIKEASAPTLAGSFIRAQIPKVMSDTLGGVQQNLGYAGDALKSNATQAVNNVGNAIGGAFNGLGNLFGGHQAQPSSWWGGNAGLSAYSGTRQPPPMPMSRPALQQVAAAVAAQQQQQNRTPKYAVSTAPGTFNRETGTWN